ncbi:hypothetical protein VMCG_05055 [Cytospora schulzeri]|uniref:Uncharacterized protein n=1 Tax=Cytospora schulzeri TaxID=448051 RepID=A0A423WMS4_9PEZI|nr:hypothetical protein VMCG_05055 [Valsa malicola]
MPSHFAHLYSSHPSLQLVLPLNGYQGRPARPTSRVPVRLPTRTPYLDQPHPPLSPAVLHPTAATSFADILRSGRLRSIFCVIGLRSCMRGTCECPGLKCHLSQTFSLCRGGSSTGGFDWLETDPRPVVQFDLDQVPLNRDPRCIVRAWKSFKTAFGVEGRTSTDNEGEISFYICPTLSWARSILQIPEEARRPPEGSREELAEHLRQEAEDWDRGREFISALLSGHKVPRHGWIVNTETFEMMERTANTAVGKWLFPVNALRDPTDVRRSCFDLSAVRPGLILYEL